MEWAGIRVDGLSAHENAIEWFDSGHEPANQSRTPKGCGGEFTRGSFSRCVDAVCRERGGVLSSPRIGRDSTLRPFNDAWGAKAAQLGYQNGGFQGIQYSAARAAVNAFPGLCMPPPPPLPYSRDVTLPSPIPVEGPAFYEQLATSLGIAAAGTAIVTGAILLLPVEAGALAAIAAGAAATTAVFAAMSVYDVYNEMISDGMSESAWMI